MYWLEFAVVYVISTVISKTCIRSYKSFFTDFWFSVLNADSLEQSPLPRNFLFTVLNADSLEHSPFQTFPD